MRLIRLVRRRLQSSNLSNPSWLSVRHALAMARQCAQERKQANQISLKPLLRKKHLRYLRKSDWVRPVQASMTMHGDIICFCESRLLYTNLQALSINGSQSYCVSWAPGPGAADPISHSNTLKCRCRKISSGLFPTMVANNLLLLSLALCLPVLSIRQCRCQFHSERCIYSKCAAFISP